MKIITLRIDEEEKARLDQLAERGNVTLSRALREGAALYLNDVQAKLHRARGGQTTWYGLRRDTSGRVVSTSTPATKRERRLVDSLRINLYDTALSAIREAWFAHGDTRVALGALGQWLNLVGGIYAGNTNEIGWSWFVADYCPAYADTVKRDQLRKEIRTGLYGNSALDVGELIEALDEGFVRLLDDAEHQDLVRRAVLPAWQVFQSESA